MSRLPSRLKAIALLAPLLVALGAVFVQVLPCRGVLAQGVQGRARELSGGIARLRTSVRDGLDGTRRLAPDRLCLDERAVLRASEPRPRRFSGRGVGRARRRTSLDRKVAPVRAHARPRRAARGLPARSRGPRLVAAAAPEPPAPYHASRRGRWLARRAARQGRWLVRRASSPAWGLAPCLERRGGRLACRSLSDHTTPPGGQPWC